MAELLQLSGISKSFGPLKALDRVNFSVGRGEIHALLGENGAGKSTLMNIAFGMLHLDSGRIVFDDQTISTLSPRKAMDLGMGMVHQHFKLVDEFTVAQNIALGAPNWKDALSTDESSRLSHFIRETGLSVDPSATVSSLPLGVRQRVEILKALFRGAKLLILDEPTAVLAPQETDELFAALKRLRDSGTSIVIITHKLAEALSIASRITVLRQGKVALTGNAGDVTNEQLAEAMVGKTLKEIDRSRGAPLDFVVMSVDDITCKPDGMEPVLDFTLALRAGEIVGIAGVEGNGQSALAQALSGITIPVSGSITLEGSDITKMGVVERLKRGISHIPGDRQTQALLLEFSLAENMLLGIWPLDKIRKGPFIRTDLLKDSTDVILKDYGIRGASIQTQAMALSGGNQQRLVTGRQLSTHPRVLIAVNPTRGLDVGAISNVHSRLLTHKQAGNSVVLISSDLDEIQKLSDRVMVLYRGQVAGEFPSRTPREEIGLVMATGVMPE